MTEEDGPNVAPKWSSPPPSPPKRTATGFGGSGDDRRRYTIKEPVSGEGKFMRGEGSRECYGHVQITIAPSLRDQGVLIFDEIGDDVIPAEFLGPIGPIAEGVRSALEAGPDERQVVDVIVHVVGGSHKRNVDRGIAFTLAGIFAVKDALKKAELLPIE